MESWVAQCLLLFFGTFIHEDVALVAAVYFVAGRGLSQTLALATLYGGVVTGDLLIYGLGAAARRLPRARRLLIGPRVEKARQRLNKHLVLSVAACRLLPGVLFPTFVACGWLGVPLLRFAAITAASAALYTFLMFYLISAFGAVILAHAGTWGWIILLGLVVGLTSRGIWKLARRAPRPQAPGPQVLDAAGEMNNGHSHRGMPPLGGLTRRVAPAERFPTLLFYSPLLARGLLLAARRRSLTLPTLANPFLATGGMWGDSKSACLRQVSGQHRRWIAPFITLRREEGPGAVEAVSRQALEAMAGAGLGFPLVAKPDIGYQGYAVRVVGDARQLRDYIAVFPPGEEFILQRLVTDDGEAGVFYVRLPGDKRGRVESLTFRYFPHVTGDGVSTLRQLLDQDLRARFKSRVHGGLDRWHAGTNGRDLGSVPPSGEVVRLSFIGSIRVGGLYRDARRYITPALSERFDAIAGSMPEFYFGRFDIRFQSLAQLQAGEGFSIIEINGAGSEAIHAWDPETPLRETYRELFRFQSLLFEVAARNRARGFQPQRFGEFYRFVRKQQRLVALYPPSA